MVSAVELFLNVGSTCTDLFDMLMYTWTPPNFSPPPPPPPHSQYADHEEVVLWMNTVGPYHNRQETCTYFSLPFCKGPQKEISHYHETLGEALQGVELEFSGLEISYDGTILFVEEQSLFVLNLCCIC